MERHTSLLAIAALAAPLETPGPDATGPGRIQLFPLGTFAARDGRPGTMKGVSAKTWRLTEEDAERLIARWAKKETPVVVDYEHQTHKSDENGQPAPAAGWVTGLHVEAGKFYAVVDWTPRARAYIRNGEYRFISPTFHFDSATGAVLDLLSVALTNYPALDGMDPAQAKTAPSQGAPMKELLKALATLLGLPDTATEAQCTAALAVLPQEPLAALIAAHEGEIATLKNSLATAQSAAPDPAKYAPVALLTATQQQLATATAELKTLKDATATAELSAEVDAALKDGRLHTNGKDWALALAKSDPEALRAYLKTAPTIAALTGQQTAGNSPPDSGTASLTAEEKEVCAQLNLSHEDFIKAKEEK